MRLPVPAVVLAPVFGLLAGLAFALWLHGALPAASSGDDAPLVTASRPNPAFTAAAAVLPADPCAGFKQAELGLASERPLFPTRTLADVLAHAPKDPWMRHTLEDIAGVRPGPLGDPRVPRCRVDLLRFGDPIFLRMYPAQTGSWLLPIMYEGSTILTMYVGVDASGMGNVGGSRGGAVPVPTETEARVAAALPEDPVVSAELIAAKPPGCGASFTAVWRLVRSKGTVVYFALDAYGVTPPGALFDEKEMRFSLGGAGAHGFASVASAC